MEHRNNEYYVIRIERKVDQTQPQTTLRDIFISESGGFGRYTRARHFSNIDEAEAYIASREDSSRYQFIVQFCSEGKQNDNVLTPLIDKIMEIPLPYRRSAHNWLRGKDVKTILSKESEEVYARHYKMLLEYDIDISQKPEVVLMKPKRRSDTTLDSQIKNGPKQFFAYPSQRPNNK